MDVRPGEAGPFAGDDEVTGERGIGAEPRGGAVDGGDHGLGHGVQQGLRVVHPLLAVPAVEGHLARRRGQAALPAGGVGAGAEALAGAREHHGADGLVGRNALQGVDELGAHVVAHGVALVRTIEGQGGDAALDLQVDEGTVHGIQSILRLFSLTTLLQRACSPRTKASSSAGAPPLTVRPSGSRRLRNSALSVAFFAATLSLVITSGGVPAGANSPYQLSMA